MATVKIHEGTKHETPLDLEDDEGIVFVVPAKNYVLRIVTPGCLYQLLQVVTLGIICIFVKEARNKQWYASFVITNKRIIVIPRLPNKKNDPVESFYWKDIVHAKSVKAQKQSDAAGRAEFSVTIKAGANHDYPKGELIQFYLCAEASLKTAFNVMKAAHAENAAANAAVMGATMRTFDEGVYTSKSLDKYYAAMEKRAKDRAANLDFSKADHSQMRDYIVDVINDCVDEVNKG